MVSRIPIMDKFLLNVLCTFFTVNNSCANPSSAKNSHCIGIRILSDAVNAFKVVIPNPGGQSMKT